MVHAERKGPGRRLRHVGHDNYFVGGISDEVSPAARYRRRRRSSDRTGRVWPARGDGRRGIAASGVRSAGVRPLLQRRERQADARGQCDLGQPARGPGGGLARRRRDRLERHRLGGQHLHRGAPLQGLRQHRGERVDGADHGRWAAPSRRSRSKPTREGRRRRRGVGVLGPRRPRPAPRPSTETSSASGTTDAAGTRRVRRHRGDDRPATSSRSASTSTRASATRSTAGSGYTAAQQRLQGIEHRPADRGPGRWRRRARLPTRRAGAGAKTVVADGHGRVPGRRSGGAADGPRHAHRRVGHRRRRQRGGHMERARATAAARSRATR